MSDPILLVVDDVSFDLHRPVEEDHPERPERLHVVRRALSTIRATKVSVPVREATEDELGSVHSAQYVEKLVRSQGKSRYWDEDTYAGPDSARIARCAAGGGLDMVSRLIKGEAQFGAALLRPPGHHARPSGAMGFCLVNNVAVAAAHARSLGLRVLILDFDVHHGNGTQEIFESDPNVLFISVHQFPTYPGTGRAQEVGKGDGLGFTANVPLSAGAKNADYVYAFDVVVIPLVYQFKPDLILLSAGFDAHEADPVGGMQLTSDVYKQLVQQVRYGAPTMPIGLFLEGGYSLNGLEHSFASAIKGLIANPEKIPIHSASGTHACEVLNTRKELSPLWSDI